MQSVGIGGEYVNILTRGRGGANLYSLSRRGTTRGSNVQNREMEDGVWYKNHLPKEVDLFKYYLKMSYPEFR
jgi:hypothetical protein